MDTSLAPALRPWLSDGDTLYHFVLPGYYDRTQLPWLALVEEHWETIRDELMSVIARQGEGFDPYPDLTKTSKKGSWQTAGLIYWTQKSPTYIAMFPKTWEIVRRVPNLSSCSLNRLQARSTIKPHIGDTDAMYRCHIGLVVPASAPRCGFRVGSEIRSWEEGRALVFNDAYEHTAWNNTDDDRYIISFDVLRPECVSSRYWTSAQILGKIWVEVIYQHKPWLARWFAQPATKRVLTAAAKAAIWCRVRWSAFTMRHV